VGESAVKLLAITCYAGEKPYVDMTEKMLRDLVASLGAAMANGLLESWHISVLAQGTRGAEWPAITTDSRWPITFEEVEQNKGYAWGMNRAHDNGLRDYEPDALLCLNNDIEMPNKGWLGELLCEYVENRILCPKTNYTSVNEQRAAGPEDKPFHDHGVTPAVCWLMPGSVVGEILAHLNGKLFPEDLGGRAWGEDNYTSGIVRTKVHPVPFRIVPRSWIHHLGAKTSSKIPPEERMKAHHEAHRRMKAEGMK
jgi:hypothetical protein